MANEQKKLFQNKTQVYVAIGVILAIVLIGVILFLPSSDNSTVVENSKLEIGSSPVLGAEDAAVIIYEFSDFSCPFCAAAEGANFEVVNQLKSRVPGWEAPLPAIKKEYIDTGKVKLVFKYFPGHGAASAAHAVAFGLHKQKPELFWKFAEKAFVSQSTSNLDDINKMKALAKDLGANETELNAYLDSKEYETQLSSDIKMAGENGVRGTPTFFINGQIIAGAQPFSVFKEAIDKELSK
ncbi:MAG TPA: thioredoxin domain-containing protein [Candidatus Nanoarchaeia archaeon]|nr:thioredoxin domain-containing protein [Candidatus Nanoarchaeia archaeon]